MKISDTVNFYSIFQIRNYVVYSIKFPYSYKGFKTLTKLYSFLVF